MTKRKQAVLLIHGIGEQRPMDTLRGFVDTVWTTHTQIHTPQAGAAIWSKPDTVSESFELRRLTTGRHTGDVRTDFFEFYWAHLMQGTATGTSSPGRRVCSGASRRPSPSTCAASMHSS